MFLKPESTHCSKIGCKSFKFFTIIDQRCCGCPASWEVDKMNLINFHTLTVSLFDKMEKKEISRSYTFH